MPSRKERAKIKNATAELRRRNKVIAGRDQLSSRGHAEYEKLSLGQRGKKTTIPTQQCDFKIDGKEVMIFRKRKNPAPGQDPNYMVLIVRGGTRCIHTAQVVTPTKRRCMEHVASTYERETPEPPKSTGSPRSGM